MIEPRTLRVFAPAKINLMLHVTGLRDDGYHTLESLAAFADIGDTVTIRPATEFSFDITGPQAKAFTAKERDASPHSSNLAVKAAWLAAREFQKNLHVAITLEKELPLASGIGGGTADAAAVLWGLMEFWHVSQTPDNGRRFMRELGADFPVCFLCKPAWMGGAGENLQTLELPEIPILLVNPLQACPTRDVFMHRQGPYSAPLGDNIPASLSHPKDLLSFLRTSRNDLTQSASGIIPEISNTLNALEYKTGCLLARMSGSGATCFGLFDTIENAQAASDTIARENPDWWVREGMLNRPERY
ncbi:MAG: 4-(cytidine 5'-diphospho)-2-C-methyl-D-erythritol kinase [Alphaproteobacteria bacterium]|nr:4-(cytidine 5'-diphospho)-2-C-methyl-D-erythritol kinase [Alphaproteobacteria bacterium]